MLVVDNCYVKNVLQRVKNHRLNHACTKVMNQCSKFDSILDYETFREYILREVKTIGVERNLIFQEYGAEGNLYGHRQALLHYAQMEGLSKANFYLPNIEHGINFIPLAVYKGKAFSGAPLVFQGEYKKQSVRQEFPYNPIFCIGPYICYAHPYYSEEKTVEIKKRMGKTILLFPVHGCEGSEITYDRSAFVKEFLAEFKNAYDTILISVYWNDVDDPLLEAFRAEGAVLVSAGFREDPLFISRLRSMIELADATASNQIGTHIGYCMALGKPHYLFNTPMRIEDYHVDEAVWNTSFAQYNLTETRFIDAFKHMEPTEDEEQKQHVLFEKYWGGMSRIKTPAEMMTLLSLTKKLFDRSLGSRKRYEGIVREIKEGKRTDRHGLSGQEIVMLLEAL